MFSISNIKSPGTDGFSNGFFKTTWAITGPLICSAIQQFFKTGDLPSRLGVPITASRLTKSECSELVEKIQAKVRIWATRSLSFAGRWLGHPKYTVSSGYKWLMGEHCRVAWAPIPWARTVIPRHDFIVWILFQHRLPTKVRQSKYNPHLELGCTLCHRKDEEDFHLFFECIYAKEICRGLSQWWNIPNQRHSCGLHFICHLRGRGVLHRESSKCGDIQIDNLARLKGGKGYNGAS
ncbi:hypothetical protein Cgig2_008718 [Carnegiea gigantea]|uniref:Reverse transcriptase zinc-binding domain-containing protein n=1 Tax=Carnegiea gigantea TaxID=171969 RepID=A0A9Q1GGM1_9CARY|nr:hypothetical protein Cgig2_008718 [Carnegiea gigantea]